jgi:hypothetical protein
VSDGETQPTSPEGAPANSVAEQLARAFTPGNFSPVALMIGVFTVTSLAAAEASLSISALRDFMASLFAIVDLWLVGGIFVVLGIEFGNRTPMSWRERFTTVLSHTGVLTGAALPMVVMAIFLVAGGSARVVDAAGFITGMVTIMLIMVLTALRAGYSTMGRLAQVGAGVLICLIIVFERVVLR